MGSRYERCLKASLWAGTSTLLLFACAELQTPAKDRDAAVHRGGSAAESGGSDGGAGTNEVGGTNETGGTDEAGGATNAGGSSNAGGTNLDGGAGKAEGGKGGAGRGGSGGADGGPADASRGGAGGSMQAGGGGVGGGLAEAGIGGGAPDSSVPTDAPCEPTVESTLPLAANAGKASSTAAYCIRITGTVLGWNGSSMQGRTVTVNGGKPISPDSGGGIATQAAPGKWTDGTTYFAISAGQHEYAALAIW